MLVEITFTNPKGLNPKPFGKARNYESQEHVDRYIKYMQKKGFILDEVYEIQ
jgi:hypothetical protein